MLSNFKCNQCDSSTLKFNFSFSNFKMEYLFWHSNMIICLSFGCWFHIVAQNQLFLFENFHCINANIFGAFNKEELTGNILSFYFSHNSQQITINYNWQYAPNRCWFIFNLKWILYVRYATISKMKIEFCTNLNLKRT